MIPDGSIAAHQVSTLVPVDRKTLADQWRARIVLGVLILGETVTVITLAGIALVLAG